MSPEVSYNKESSLCMISLPMPTLAKAVQTFLEHLQVEKNRSAQTIKTYNYYLHRFLLWAAEHHVQEPKHITIGLIHSYRLWLHQRKNRYGEQLNASTRNSHLIALRSLLKYLAKLDIATLASEKIELGKMPERQPQFLEDDELERLLEAPLQKKPPGVKNDLATIRATLRDKAILELLFSTGLRVSELSKLFIENVNLKRDDFSVRGKGGKVRMVFLSDRAKRALKDYLEKRIDMSPYLFVRHDPAAGKSQITNYKSHIEMPLTPRSIERLVLHYAKVAGITKRITPHTLRHTFGTDLLRNGADLRAVQTLLGHSSITTTQIYTHVTDQHLREVHKAFHGKRRDT